MDQAISVSTQYDPARNAALVIIEDEGKGMSENELERVKEPFFTTKRLRGGTGLGVSISNSIVEDHLGRLEYFPNEPRGTKVVISFPASMDEAEGNRP
jgi:signal transduction histidine kinase